MHLQPDFYDSCYPVKLKSGGSHHSDCNIRVWYSKHSLALSHRINSILLRESFWNSCWIYSDQVILMSMIHPETKVNSHTEPPNAGTYHPLFLWILFRHFPFHLLTKSSFPLNTHPSISQGDKWDWELNIHIQFLSCTEGCSQQTANLKKGKKKLQWHPSLWAPVSHLDEATESEIMNSKSLIFPEYPITSLLKGYFSHKWKLFDYLSTLMSFSTVISMKHKMRILMNPYSLSLVKVKLNKNKNTFTVYKYLYLWFSNTEIWWSPCAFIK